MYSEWWALGTFNFSKRILPAIFVEESESPLVNGLKSNWIFLILYSREDFRKEFQEQNPDIKSMRDVCYSLETQILISQWICIIY